MDEQALKLPSAVEGYSAYDLRSVERFLLDACEERGRVMEEIAVTRRRLAEADAQLARSSDTEVRLARSYRRPAGRSGGAASQRAGRRHHPSRWRGPGGEDHGRGP